jgi:7-keto-8-aminopelargonate synthetase-like enzyme
MTAPGVIFSDERNHASIVYGLRLAGCPVEIYEHNNMDQLAEHLGRYDHEMPKLIVSDGVFSMDGDLAPLADIARLADECGADIYLDDAHGIGVLGATGRGSIEHLGLDAGFDLLMGTYSKAFGGAGGFVAGESEVVEYLRMTSISAIFTAPIPPPTAAGLRVSVGIVRAEPERRERIQRNAALFRALLHENDFNTLDSETHIVPVLVGDDRKTADAVQAMVDRGVFALEGRWPAVRSGYGRLRFTVTALHSEDDIAHAVGVLRDVRDHVGFSDFGAVATG